jgi:hypothetical protein
VNKEAYIRKSHSFTKESLEDLGILSKYMGDIGESAVLRYLIINEIRKVPAFQGPMRITLTDEDAEKLRALIENASPGEVIKVPAFKPNRELEEERLFKAGNQLGRSQELKEKLADFTIEKLEEFEKNELDRVIVPRRIVPELLGEKTRAFLEGLKDEKKDNV